MEKLIRPKKLALMALAALAIVLAVYAPSQAREGGGHSGFAGGHPGGFGGHQGFDGNHDFDGRHGFDGRHEERFERFDRFDRFHRFHRFGFFGDFGFVGPVFGFGVYPFYWDPFWFPSPYPAYTYAPPLVIEPEPQVSVQQPSSSTTPAYWYYCVDAKAYYPYTQHCPGGWLKVAPTP